MDSVVYVSLGYDCSVAYQLNKLGLRKFALPFDWIRIKNIDDIKDILLNDFQFFVDKEYLEIKNTSNKFFFIGEDEKIIKTETQIVKHKKYNILFPHDLALEYGIEFMISKYIRRINRFRELILDDSIKKIFIRITNKIENYDFLSLVCRNYEIKIIKDNNKIRDWQKDDLFIDFL